MLSPALEQALASREYNVVAKPSSTSGWATAQRGSNGERLSIIRDKGIESTDQARLAETTYQQNIRRFTGTRNIAQIRDFVSAQSGPEVEGALVTEFLAASWENDHEEIEKSEDMLRWMSQQLLRGLCSLLENNYHHGSIGPQNVVFRSSCDALLLVPHTSHLLPADDNEKVFKIGHDLYSLGRFLLQAAGAEDADIQALDDRAYDPEKKVYLRSRLTPASITKSLDGVTPPPEFSHFLQLLLSPQTGLRDLWESDWIQKAKRPHNLFQAGHNPLSASYLHQSPFSPRSTGALHSVGSLKSLYEKDSTSLGEPQAMNMFMSQDQSNLSITQMSCTQHDNAMSQSASMKQQDSLAAYPQYKPQSEAGGSSLFGAGSLSQGGPSGSVPRINYSPPMHIPGDTGEGVFNDGEVLQVNYGGAMSVHSSRPTTPRDGPQMITPDNMKVVDAPKYAARSEYDGAASEYASDYGKASDYSKPPSQYYENQPPNSNYGDAETEAYGRNDAQDYTQQPYTSQEPTSAYSSNPHDNYQYQQPTSFLTHQQEQYQPQQQYQSQPQYEPQQQYQQPTPAFAAYGEDNRNLPGVFKTSFYGTPEECFPNTKGYSQVNDKEIFIVEYDGALQKTQGGEDVVEARYLNDPKMARTESVRRLPRYPGTTSRPILEPNTEPCPEGCRGHSRNSQQGGQGAYSGSFQQSQAYGASSSYNNSFVSNVATTQTASYGQQQSYGQGSSFAQTSPPPSSKRPPTYPRKTSVSASTKAYSTAQGASAEVSSAQYSSAQASSAQYSSTQVSASAQYSTSQMQESSTIIQRRRYSGASQLDVTPFQENAVLAQSAGPQLTGHALTAAYGPSTMLLLRDDKTEKIPFTPLQQDLNSSMTQPIPFQRYPQPLPASSSGSRRNSQQSSDEYGQQIQYPQYAFAGAPQPQVFEPYTEGSNASSVPQQQYQAY